MAGLNVRHGNGQALQCPKHRLQGRRRRLFAKRTAFDQAGLERYLGAHVPEAVPILGASQFAAGQSNPTYLIEGPERRSSQHFLGAQMREIAEICSSSAGEARYSRWECR